MAIQPKNSTIVDVTEKVTELNEKLFESGKKVGAAHIDSYEKVVLELTGSYEKAAARTQVEWVETAVALQAGVARDLAKTYTAAARELVA
jgi:hypothetical protein